MENIISIFNFVSQNVIGRKMNFDFGGKCIRDSFETFKHHQLFNNKKHFMKNSFLSKKTYLNFKVKFSM